MRSNFSKTSVWVEKDFRELLDMFRGQGLLVLDGGMFTTPTQPAILLVVFANDVVIFDCLAAMMFVRIHELDRSQDDLLVTINRLTKTSV